MNIFLYFQQFFSCVLWLESDLRIYVKPSINNRLNDKDVDNGDNSNIDGDDCTKTTNDGYNVCQNETCKKVTT